MTTPSSNGFVGPYGFHHRLAVRPAAARDLKFGFTPVLGEAEMRAEFDPLAAYLSDAIGQKVVLYIAKDYGDCKIQTALVDMDKSPAGRQIIANSKKKLTGHVIAEDSLFDVVRRTAKTAGM